MSSSRQTIEKIFVEYLAVGNHETGFSPWTSPACSNGSHRRVRLRLRRLTTNSSGKFGSDWPRCGCPLRSRAVTERATGLQMQTDRRLTTPTCGAHGTDFRHPARLNDPGRALDKHGSNVGLELRHRREKKLVSASGRTVMGAPAQWQRPGARRAADRPRAAGALREQVGIQKKLGVSIELRVATHRLACSHNAGPAELGRRLFQVLGQAGA